MYGQIEQWGREGLLHPPVVGLSMNLAVIRAPANQASRDTLPPAPSVSVTSVRNAAEQSPAPPRQAISTCPILREFDLGVSTGVALFERAAARSFKHDKPKPIGRQVECRPAGDLHLLEREPPRIGGQIGAPHWSSAGFGRRPASAPSGHGARRGSKFSISNEDHRPGPSLARAPAMDDPQPFASHEMNRYAPMINGSWYLISSANASQRGEGQDKDRTR